MGKPRTKLARCQEQMEDARNGIQWLHELGWKATAISRVVGCHRHTATKWIQAAKNGDGIKDRDRSGRPTKLTPRMLKRIETLLKNRRHTSTRKVAQQLKANGGAGVSTTSVRRAAKKLGLTAKRTQRKPMKPEGCKAKRLRFMKAMRNFDFKKGVFADEATFHCHAPPNPRHDYTWVESKAEAPCEPTVAHGAKLHAYGAIWYDGKTSIAVFKENMTSAVMIEKLKKYLLPATRGLVDWTYFHDNGPTHKAKATQAFLEEKKVKVCKPDVWPANSPDLNPIENVWSKMKDVVHRIGPQTTDELETAIKKAWREVATDELRHNLIDSMPRRLTAVHKANGASTRF